MNLRLINYINIREINHLRKRREYYFFNLYFYLMYK